MPNSTQWQIEFSATAIKTEYDTYFEKYPKQHHVKLSFEENVTENPFFHPTYRRIIHLKGNLKGKLRYGKSKTRIIYETDKASHTVYPLETGKITDAPYKKRSKKK